MHDVVILIPTKRPPPLKTLTSYAIPQGVRAIVVADPEVIDFHQGQGYEVIEGKRGLAQQVAYLYQVAALKGFRYFFRLDDDLPPRFFIDCNGAFPNLTEVLDAARECADVTATTLVGFCNSSRTDWLGTPGHFSRSYGLIHGGASLVRSAFDPGKYLDTRLRRFEDVYRSLSHREQDGAVGRVAWIGLRKSAPTKDSVKDQSPEVITEAIQIITERFPGMIKFDGTKLIDGGTREIPKVVFLRGKKR